MVVTAEMRAQLPGLSLGLGTEHRVVQVGCGEGYEEQLLALASVVMSIVRVNVKGKRTGSIAYKGNVLAVVQRSVEFWSRELPRSAAQMPLKIYRPRKGKGAVRIRVSRQVVEVSCVGAQRRPPFMHCAYV